MKSLGIIGENHFLNLSTDFIYRDVANIMILSSYGYTRMIIHNNTHLYLEQVSVDKVSEFIRSIFTQYVLTFLEINMANVAKISS